jgi:hypothetical protein
MFGFQFSELPIFTGFRFFVVLQFFFRFKKAQYFVQRNIFAVELINHILEFLFNLIRFIIFLRFHFFVVKTVLQNSFTQAATPNYYTPQKSYRLEIGGNKNATESVYYCFCATYTNRIFDSERLQQAFIDNEKVQHNC